MGNEKGWKIFTMIVTAVLVVTAGIATGYYVSHRTETSGDGYVKRALPHLGSSINKPAVKPASNETPQSNNTGSSTGGSGSNGNSGGNSSGGTSSGNTGGGNALNTTPKQPDALHIEVTGVKVLTTCDACGGSGKINCETCRGAGRIACSQCGGIGCQLCGNSGYEPCPVCKGATTLNCLTCGGSGHVWK